MKRSVVIQEFIEIQSRKENGSVLWFIEYKQTGKWFCYKFESKDDLLCTYRECYSSGYRFKRNKEGWTSNPQEAQGYLTKDIAQQAAFGYFVIHEPFENITVTQYDFVGVGQMSKLPK